jgi:hypothetical protein
MKIQTLAIAVALFVGATATLAAEPPPAAAAPAAPKSSAAGPAAESTVAAASSPAAPSATAAAANDAAATAKAAHTLGYVPKSRNGKLVYCKPEASLGTRLQHMSCFSEDEMTAVVRRSVENQDSLARTQRTELYQEGKF